MRLRAKLLAELPENALVVDYTAAVGGEAAEEAEAAEGRGGEGRGGAPAGRRFVLLEKVRAPVSWDAGHVFWVWRCESVPVAPRVVSLATSSDPQYPHGPS